MRRKLVELIRVFREIGLKRFLKIARINRQVVPLIKGFALTQVIGSLQQLGVFAQLKAAPATAAEIAASHSLRLDVLEPLLDYLSAAGILRVDAGRWRLSEHGAFVTLEPHGLFLLFRAYGSIFMNLDRLLKGEAAYGKDIYRDEVWMATGSSQIVQWLPIPVVLNWLSAMSCHTLIDIGCGAGDFLGEVGRTLTQCRLVGVDRSADIIRLAQTRNPGRQGDRRITYHVVDAMSEPDLHRLRENVPQADAISVMFVLHELVYAGMDVTRMFLRNLRQSYPSARLMICEIMRPTPEKRAEAHSGNELLLYHALSHQRPLTLEGWLQLFTETGYQAESVKTFELMSQAYFMLTPLREFV